jgi:transcriptional antiterminator
MIDIEMKEMKDKLNEYMEKVEKMPEKYDLNPSKEQILSALKYHLACAYNQVNNFLNI